MLWERTNLKSWRKQIYEKICVNVQAHMLCRTEERPDNDERFISIVSSVSFIMLKKGDYIKAKAFAEQVYFNDMLKILIGK